MREFILRKKVVELYHFFSENIFDMRAIQFHFEAKQKTKRK